MLTAYFDESHEETFRFTFVCGWVATVEQWKQFKYGWKLFLAKFDVPYFHMREFAHSVGPFAKWKDKRLEGTRRAFMRTAAQIIVDSVQRGFVCGVNDEIFAEYDKVFELSNWFNSPYALAGRTSANLVSEWASLNPTLPRRDIDYVFEDGEEDKGGLLYAMQEITPSLPVPIFRPGRNQKPIKKYPNGRRGLVQLQAADYLAYEISKFVRDHPIIKLDNSRFRASLGMLPEKMVKRIFFTGRKTGLMCNMLKIKRRQAT